MGELLAAVTWGIGATITPCILPLYPAFLAYLTAPRLAAPGSAATRVPPIAAAALVWLGVVLGMVAIGALFAVLAVSLSGFIRIVLPLADGLLIVLGALLLLGRNPFARLPQLSLSGVGRLGPVVGALGYGILFAPIALPCSGVFLVGIFAFSLTIGDVAGQLVFFLPSGWGSGCLSSCWARLGRCRARRWHGGSSAGSGRCSSWWALPWWPSAPGTLPGTCRT